MEEVINWIDIKEKLPEFLSNVIVQRSNGDEVPCYYHGDGLGRMAWYYKPGVISDFQSKHTNEFIHDTTHWRYL